MVMFLYRDKYYETGEKPEVEDAEVIIAKNRQGATRTVMVKWWARKTLFFEPEQRDAPEAPPEFTAHQGVSPFADFPDDTNFSYDGLEPPVENGVI